MQRGGQLEPLPICSRVPIMITSVLSSLIFTLSHNIHALNSRTQSSIAEIASLVLKAQSDLEGKYITACRLHKHVHLASVVWPSQTVWWHTGWIVTIPNWSLVEQPCCNLKALDQLPLGETPWIGRKPLERCPSYSKALLRRDSKRECSTISKSALRSSRTMQ